MLVFCGLTFFSPVLFGKSVNGEVWSEGAVTV